MRFFAAGTQVGESTIGWPPRASRCPTATNPREWVEQCYSRLHAKRTDEPSAAPGGPLEGLSGESRLQLLFAPIFGVCFYQAAAKGQFAAFGDPLVAGKAIVQFVVVTQVLQFAAQQAKARRE